MTASGRGWALTQAVSADPFSVPLPDGVGGRLRVVSGYGWPVHPITTLLCTQPETLFRTVSPALPFQGKGLSGCLPSNVYFCLLCKISGGCCCADLQQGSLLCPTDFCVCFVYITFESHHRHHYLS